MGWILKILGSMFILIYLALNFYVGLRSLQGIRSFYPSVKSLLFWIVFLVIAFAYIADRAFGLNFPPLKVVGSYWLAAFFYLFLLYFLIDLAGFINSAFHVFPSSWELYWSSKKIYSFALFLTIGILTIGSWVAYSPQIIKYDVQISKKVPGLENLKVVMISDLHIETLSYTAPLEKAAQTITSRNPDLILLSGDIVESYLDSATEEKLDRVVANLQSKYGLYAVLGNHEYYGGQADKITEFLRSKNITVLRDEITESVNDQIYIAGRNDYRSGHMDTKNRKPLNEFLEGIDPAKPLLLLDHQPQAVTEAKEAGVDLMLSGHTHGGQLFPAQLVTKALFVIDRGLWKEGEFHLIVTTGLGIWGPPIKTSAKSEIVEINLSFK